MFKYGYFKDFLKTLNLNELIDVMEKDKIKEKISSLFKKMDSMLRKNYQKKVKVFLKDEYDDIIYSKNINL